MSTQAWCDGAGQRVAVNEPTALVNSPVCARKGLGALHVGGGDASANYDRVGDVPPHRAKALRPEQIPEMKFGYEPTESEWRLGYWRPM